MNNGETYNMNNPVIQMLNLDGETSMVRATETVRLHIIKAANPIAESNRIIETLGGQQVDRAYKARLVAQNMVRDCLTAGSAFDHVKSFKNALAVADWMEQKYPSFANSEDNPEQTVEPIREVITLPKVPKARKPSKMAEAIVASVVKKINKTKMTKEVAPEVLLPGGFAKRQRSSSTTVADREEMVRQIVGENKELSKKEMVALVVERLGVGQSVANNCVHRAKEFHGLLRKRG